jgi:threonine aldolase
MSGFRVDLRSDTVSKPSDAMRKAMAEAEVGDAWYGDDPTVNRLQELAAEITGHEAALYVPTGTMGNQIALALHVHGGGHLVACASVSHVATVELTTSAALSGIAFRTIDAGAAGWVTPDLARSLLAPDTFYDVEVVDLLSVENTVGTTGGRVMPAEAMSEIRRLANEAGVPVHLDGARIFNAAAATGQDVRAWTAQADTVMFCVSKGLGAPIGSLICGTAEAMRDARRLSVLFGGAWRQAGIMAAAGILALDEGPARLREDHGRARRLAEGVAEILPDSVDLNQVETNMVFVDTQANGVPLFEALARLGERGIGATHTAGKVRMVTHVDVDDDDVSFVLDGWRTLAQVE